MKKEGGLVGDINIREFCFLTAAVLHVDGNSFAATAMGSAWVELNFHHPKYSIKKRYTHMPDQFQKTEKSYRTLWSVNPFCNHFIAMVQMK
eukprot:1749797-Amphidinium_carterae.2